VEHSSQGILSHFLVAAGTGLTSSVPSRPAQCPALQLPRLLLLLINSRRAEDCSRPLVFPRLVAGHRSSVVAAKIRVSEKAFTELYGKTLSGSYRGQHSKNKPSF